MFWLIFHFSRFHFNCFFGLFGFFDCFFRFFEGFGFLRGLRFVG